MPNAFDQYAHHENRLTHALLSALDHDRGLLDEFLQAHASTVAFDTRTLTVAEQTLPWAESTERRPERRDALPDGVIYDARGSILVVESKVRAPLDIDQIVRHERAVCLRGFEHVSGLAITAVASTLPFPKWTATTWADVYRWLRARRDGSFWARELAEFLEIAEAQMLQDEYLGDLAITRFAGIPFGASHPYSYPEGKRLLRLLMRKIRSDEAACARIGIDMVDTGRAAITEEPVLWDVLRLTGYAGTEPFTRWPHMTVGIGRDLADAMLTIPNGANAQIWNKLAGAATDDLRAGVWAFLDTITSAFPALDGVRPQIRLHQRRYPSQRSRPFHDALLTFDVRTAFETADRAGPRHQPEWLALTQAVLRGRDSNLQFQIGCEFDYERCPGLSGEDADQLFMRAMVAGATFLDALGLRSSPLTRPGHPPMIAAAPPR